MSATFDLVITADDRGDIAEFRLLDAGGVQVGFRCTDFTKIAVSRREGLFDLRNYLRRYFADGGEDASIAEIGVCIAEEVLGAEIFGLIWRSEAERTLRIRLPGAGPEANPLVAELARVPWEIARPAAGEPTLRERHMVVRMVQDMKGPGSEPLGLGANEDLRVLFIFAEARGSLPLGARKERRALLQLFEKEIYPKRRVVAHVLSHGVTRERLRSQIEENGGYHILHWSGHGHLNLLELAKPGGEKDPISGDTLLDQTGGLIPQLVYLSACHSGDIARVQDWKGFFAVAEGKQPGVKAAEGEARDRQRQPGYTGTAHALLQRGVPSVVAMRYAVTDDYARELAVEFYRRLLADPRPKAPAEALMRARRALLDKTKHDGAPFFACDHATPVFYGAEQRGAFEPGQGRSPAHQSHERRLHRIAELTTAGHEHFVGRTWELARLGSDFIGSRGGAEVKPVAVVTGLGGMGKTALVAEALALWETRFEWVLLYQSKGNALSFDATLLDIDRRLASELRRYHAHIKEWPAAAIYARASAEFRGEERLERLTSNLIRALKDEPILLVLDNFETNLKPNAERAGAGASSVWACQDPAWERCLTRLAEELVGSPSRVLITCRRPLAALARVASHAEVLGPLSSAEAALFAKEHPGLRRLVFSSAADDRKLAERLLDASRFHPLLMDRLARLADEGPAQRDRLLETLEALETKKGFARLPALFAADPGDTGELAYLEDALATSHDVLIAAVGPAARCLLWMVAIANEPVALGLLRGVWRAESPEQPEASVPPALAPLLRQLAAVGLMTEEKTGPEDDNPDLSCHEVVRERILAWMVEHPQDRGAWTDDTIRLGYAEWLAAVYHALEHKDLTLALQAGSRALVYCVQAGAHDRLGRFASGVVTSSRDPRLLAGLIPHLQIAAESAPEGEVRWSCLCCLADALLRSGHPEESLAFYERAADQARVIAEAEGEGSREAWSDIAWITGNWAHALSGIGRLDLARQRHLESAEAERSAGAPAIRIVGSELEALRIDIMEGRAEAALPEIETRLAEVKVWWQEHRAGRPVAEAPNAESLARTLIGALDIATDAHFVRDTEDSRKAALNHVDAILAIKRDLKRPEEDIAGDRMNRANLLGPLQRFDEARAELEACLEIFKDNPANCAAVLGSLANLFGEQGDVPQAIQQQRRALAMRERLPDPRNRAISHSNLGSCLDRSGKRQDRTEAPLHQLAALLYRIDAKLDLRISLRNYAADYGRAKTAGTVVTVPRVTELLAEPAFDSLKQFLGKRQTDLQQLQAAVDAALDAARRIAIPEP